MFIPHDLIVTDEKVCSHNGIGELFEENDRLKKLYEPIPYINQRATWLMSVGQDESNEFHSWVKVMPDNCDSHPAFLSAEEKEALDGSSLLRHIEENEELMKKNHQVMSEDIPDFNHTYE